MMHQQKFRKSLVIGGSSGIGLALALQLNKHCNQVVIVDKAKPEVMLENNMTFVQHNLISAEYDKMAVAHKLMPQDIDILIITAGIGRVSPFEDILPKEIDNTLAINTIVTTHLLHFYFRRMQETAPFYCAIMSSIAGKISSPLFALYGASKAAVSKLIESLNVELEKHSTTNRILEVAPGSIKGTKFNGSEHTELGQLNDLAQKIIQRMLNRETLYIPDYEKVFKSVLQNYHDDAHQFGLQSYQYKIDSGRFHTKPQLKIGYLSGTFDLFHIGHLNLLRRAKNYCDYLVVGVHKDASHKGKIAFIPFDERCEIVRSVRYVDKVIKSMPEDDDIYKQNIVKYDCLFVGSDYQGSARFNAYEKYFADKQVEIIYLPYTQGTSSTKLREVLSQMEKKYYKNIPNL